MMEPSTPGSSPLPAAFWAGGLGGFVAGTVDTCSSWMLLDQFAPSFGAKVEAVLIVAGLYGPAFALASVVITMTWIFLSRQTFLGSLIRELARRHRDARAADPRAAMVLLSIACSAPATFGLALYSSFSIGTEVLEQHRHAGLIVASIVAITVGLSLAAWIATAVVARGVEQGLRRLPQRALRIASHPSCAVSVLIAWAIGPTAVVAWMTRETLAQLTLRPGLVVGGGFLATLTVLSIGKRIARFQRRQSATMRDGARAGFIGLLLLLSLGFASIPGPRKAATEYSGLALSLIRAVQWVVDFDRDGSSSVFGGDDCDDFSSTIHPGAFDFPDDGIDQNCVGGDLRVQRDPANAHYASLPEGVPRDLNVLLVTIDTLRSDHVGSYGYGRPTTPALDGLAADGALFEDAWAHAPSTRYSMPAILTGRYPSQISWDMSVWWPALRPENVTLAEVVRGRGLRTAGIFNYSYFDRVRRFDQGFDDYDNRNAALHQGADPASTRGTSSVQQADAAIAWLDRYATQRFFLWVHFYDPHYQYERHPGTAEFGDTPIDRYDHEIRFTDDQLARVFDRLRAQGRWDRTVTVVTGDHGEGFGERGIAFHGYHLYAQQTRVPLIIRVPGLPPRRVRTPVGHVDIFPTIANLLGATPTPGLSGRSLVPELAGSMRDEDRDVFQEVAYEGPTNRYALITQRWHLIYNMNPDNSWELYDRRADATETRDVWGEHDASEPQHRLLSWIDGLRFSPEVLGRLAQAHRSERPAPAHPLNVDFGSFVLLGWDIAPDPARPGTDATVTWYFEPREPLEGTWKLFIHIAGPSPMANADHEPVGGALPFSSWSAGGFIVDSQTIYVPPNTRAGSYAMTIGVWNPSRNERLPILSPGATNNEVVAGAFEVGSTRP